ncbi:MAG: helix-turn-helix domain-containing protein [Bryobacterales bacterium]|nr:helix-turn-helix domain-containing protein [Bryobacterales bacterium]
MRYAAKFEPDHQAGGYVVKFPDFGYGVTQGETEEEALDMASDLLDGLIGDCIEEGKPLPDPIDRYAENWHMVRPGPLADAKAELYRAFTNSGMTKAELSRRTGIKEANINRLFKITHHSRIDQLDAAFRALGLRLFVDVRGVEHTLTAP